MERKPTKQRRVLRPASRNAPPAAGRRYPVQVRATFVRLARAPVSHAPAA